MKEPVFINVEPTFKLENGVWVLDIDGIVLPDNIRVVEKMIVSIPPQKFAGNHKHPRSEAFIGLGEELEFAWLDAHAKIKKRSLMQGRKLFLTLTPPYLPHVIVNRSDKT